jgi:hypothetical protein
VLTATENQPTGTNAESASPSASLIEMSDEEILAWLSTSILDEPDPEGTPAEADPPSADFWEQVAVLQAKLSELGYDGTGATQRAIGLVGLEASLQGEVLDEPSSLAAPVGDEQLLALQAELVERAGRAVALWATLQGSSLRAASSTKG